ncbi:MAG: radical SAM protein [Candidatus Hadarchaeum sp.]|uniref:radical SAM protein n=1 Tax=Candidatus Hadarchaeum sp. TaxID=2883567 RepID=UPI003D13C5A7
MDGFFTTRRGYKSRCQLCDLEANYISEALGVCPTCVREHFDEAKPYLSAAHARVRRKHGLPPEPPRDGSGVECNDCGNRCRISVGRKGLCGVVENLEGKLVRRFGTPEKGLLTWYYDPLPTNCVPADFCAGSGGAGYPKWCRTPQGDIGYFNLSIFLGSCTYNCLYCQNYGYHELTVAGFPTISAGQLAEKADERVGCACYFGGDPSSQMPFVIASARVMREAAEKEGRLLRVCLETNLSMNRSSLEKFTELSLVSGGGVKADLKCWSPEILYALSGVDHRAAYDNFSWLARQHSRRPEVPLARASTLLVPGYVDDEEIRSLASFIADLDSTIPYSLLAFHPLHHMEDMPFTKKEDAERFLEICREEGLQKVRIGNPWLLV